MFKRFIQDEQGQSTAEYGAVLAAVAVMAALVFAAAQGPISTAIQSAFTGASTQLNNVTQAASQGAQ